MVLTADWHWQQTKADFSRYFYKEVNLKAHHSQYNMSLGHNNGFPYFYQQWQTVDTLRRLLCLAVLKSEVQVTVHRWKLLFQVIVLWVVCMQGVGPDSSCFCTATSWISCAWSCVLRHRLFSCIANNHFGPTCCLYLHDTDCCVLLQGSKKTYRSHAVT
jgi:hypothetical protein